MHLDFVGNRIRTGLLCEVADCEAGFHFTDLIIANHRIPDVCLCINFLCRLSRQVHTAVRAVCLIDITAECAAPVRIVQSDAAVECHPVLDRRSIARTAEYSWRLAVIDGINTTRCLAVGSVGAGDTLCGSQFFAVFVQPDLLICQIDFNVGISNVVSGFKRDALMTPDRSDETGNI